MFDQFAGYVTQRLADDRHVWATTLFDEVVELGYPGSYPSFTRALRAQELRPGCATCASGSHRESAIIDHPAGEKTQFDWLELPDRRLGGHAHLLVGSLAHSSRRQGVLAESDAEPADIRPTQIKPLHGMDEAGAEGPDRCSSGVGSLPDRVLRRAGAGDR